MKLSSPSNRGRHEGESLQHRADGQVYQAGRRRHGRVGTRPATLAQPQASTAGGPSTAAWSPRTPSLKELEQKNTARSGCCRGPPRHRGTQGRRRRKTQAPQRKGEAIRRMCEVTAISEHRACRLAGLSRDAFRSCWWRARRTAPGALDFVFDGLANGRRIKRLIGLGLPGNTIQVQVLNGLSDKAAYSATLAVATHTDNVAARAVVRRPTFIAYLRRANDTATSIVDSAINRIPVCRLRVMAPEVG